MLYFQNGNNRHERYTHVLASVTKTLRRTRETRKRLICSSVVCIQNCGFKIKRRSIFPLSKHSRHTHDVTQLLLLSWKTHGSHLSELDNAIFRNKCIYRWATGVMRSNNCLAASLYESRKSVPEIFGESCGTKLVFSGPAAADADRCVKTLVRISAKTILSLWRQKNCCYHACTARYRYRGGNVRAAPYRYVTRAHNGADPGK